MWYLTVQPGHVSLCQLHSRLKESVCPEELRDGYHLHHVLRVELAQHLPLRGALQLRQVVQLPHGQERRGLLVQQILIHLSNALCVKLLCGMGFRKCKKNQK